MTCFPALIKLQWGLFFEKEKTPATSADAHRCFAQFLKEITEVWGKDTQEGQVYENTKEEKLPNTWQDIWIPIFASYNMNKYSS